MASRKATELSFPWEVAGGDGGAAVPKRGAPVLEPCSKDQSYWGNPSLQQVQWP